VRSGCRDLRSDAVGETDCIEVVEYLHMRASRLDRGDIGVEIGDRADHLTELRIAQMSVDPRGVTDPEVASRNALTAQDK